MTQYTIKDPVQLLQIACGFCVVAILFAKIPLIWRIDINWDEFSFLSHVHSLARGQLDLLLQSAYTHLFRWVANPTTNEVDQVVILRLLMWPLLLLSAWLVYRLAQRFASPAGSAFAVLAFAGSWPVLKHGASFRADSMLLPLTLAMLLFVTRDDDRRLRDDIAAGLCLGLAFTLTTKAVLALPMLLALVVLPTGANGQTAVLRANQAVRRTALILGVAGILSAALIAAHATQLVPGAEQAHAFAARTVTATLLEVPFLPRGDYLRRLAMEDLVFWGGLLAGMLVALRSRAYAALACALALLPILFYRNAFPYYFPVMMAPAAVLVALAADWVGRREPPWPRGTGAFSLAVLGLILVHNAWDGLMTLRFDEQEKQRSLVAAVHEVFPAPVPYIDHSGMIPSFPKANFLMSTWGVEDYRRQGRDFMPGLLSSSRPPLLLENHPVLRPGTLLFRQLSETDRRLIQASYVDYWGPIRIAGVEATVPAEASVVVRVPIAGRYRLASKPPVRLNGELLHYGETIEFDSAQADIMASAATAGVAQTLKLVWADAREAPQRQPPKLQLYSPL